MNIIIKLSTCIIIIMINLTYGQARIGASINEIKQEFKDPYHQLNSGTNDYGVFYINVETERASVRPTETDGIRLC
jgi:hypothetical protein